MDVGNDELALCCWPLLLLVADQHETGPVSGMVVFAVAQLKRSEAEGLGFGHGGTIPTVAA